MPSCRLFTLGPGTNESGGNRKEIAERRLMRYGHVMRREEHYVRRTAIEMKVQGEGREEDLRKDG